MEIKQVIEMLKSIMGERGVPRNVKDSLERAAKDLNSKPKERKAHISNIITALDEAANDPNLPNYARTQVWGVISLLEGMK